MKDTKEKSGFLLYADWEEQVGLLTDEDAGKLFKALFAYERTRESGELPPVAAMAFAFMRKELDRNRKAYEEKCQKLRQNGAQGGRPRREEEEEKPKPTPKNQKKPNGFLENHLGGDTDTVTDTVTDTDTLPPKSPQGDESAAFGEFWRLYPKKSGQRDARAAWEELAPGKNTQSQILEALRRAKASPQWREENGRYIPKAAKWLRERRWDNLVPLPVASYDIDELEELSHFDLPEEMEL